MPACGTRSKIAMACWSEDFDLDSLLSKLTFGFAASRTRTPCKPFRPAGNPSAYHQKSFANAQRIQYFLFTKGLKRVRRRFSSFLFLTIVFAASVPAFADDLALVRHNGILRWAGDQEGGVRTSIPAPIIPTRSRDLKLI